TRPCAWAIQPRGTSSGTARLRLIARRCKSSPTSHWPSPASGLPYSRPISSITHYSPTSAQPRSTPATRWPPKNVARYLSARAAAKATAAASRALQLDAKSAEARDALDRLRRGAPLPVPERPKPGTGMLKPFGDEPPSGLQDNGPKASEKPADKNASPLTDA